jgi:glutathione synthase/RimK-type ligase-like ATP-grasp enzyme
VGAVVRGLTTVLITGARAPVALHMARLLHGAGWSVHLADSLAVPLAAGTRMKAGYHRLPSLRFDPGGAAKALAALIRRLGVDLVIPTCEEVLHLARIWRDHPMPAPLFAPPLALLEEVHDKFRFIALCERLGLPVPRTRLLRSVSDVQAVGAETGGLVFKPVWSRFATQTLIRPESRQLRQVQPTPEAPWVAQEYVVGEELCVYAVAHQGQVVAISAYRGLVRAGVGASIAFAPVKDRAVGHFVQDFVAGTGWTGQVSFDVIRQADGSVLPIECNPRATSGLHFFRDAKGFAGALLGEGAVAPAVTQPQGMRLALWIYGLRPGKLGRLRQVLADVQDVMDWPGDRIGLWGQLRPVAEIAGIALRNRIGLQAASTLDIEWNGDQSSIS